MSNAGWLVRTLVTALALVALAACSPVYRYHGFIPTDEDLEEIAVGLDTRTTVASIIGKPGASGLLAESGWYYVRSEFKHQTYQAPEETEREVVAISFDEDGVVENIERFGLERGQVVVLSRRVTDSNIKGVSILDQLFGGLGGASAIRNLINNR
ncbi:outer membrane protein assembly factor BamE [Maritimibacter fusiformis]|jgi:outer membrane protein assembly factor BamE (lipoprotein component of BamABCDE complex)|uniref:Outer membrane protein assembly factor BamE n=1 Tax=Maritimibacter fusiformis TaxID=2603819 RepID=A0A5D0RKB7_9RHOB|nr:outer membrane protein assembly factor BamE [Maritimibacter fusiformis]TYB81356.1 outer membrane protein assembly factor BamE [Maritimibacter fusiformis]